MEAGHAIRTERRGPVIVAHLGEPADEHRVNRSFVDGYRAALDEVEAMEPPRALVTAAAGRHWSTGLDLDWLRSPEGEEFAGFVADVEALLADVLVAPYPTVAAINGHCFAAGAMLALCHDVRVMRADRGFFCLPEVDVRIPFTAGMNSLVMSRLPMPAAHLAMTTGHRFGGVEAAARGLVDEAVDEGRVLDRAVEVATSVAAKDGETMRAIKQRMYGDTVALLRASEGTRPLEST